MKKILTSTFVMLASLCAWSDGLPVTGAAFHVDASDMSTLTLVEVNGTNFVSRWNDASGGSVYADQATESFRPWIDYEDGLPFVDCGPGRYGTGGTSPTGYLKWSSAVTTIREVFLVYSDYPGMSGSFLLSHNSTYQFHRSGKKLFDTTYADSKIRNGVIEVDGEAVTPTYNLPEGFHIIHLRTTGNVQANRFASDRDKYQLGAQRLREVIVYSSVLTDENAAKVYDYLDDKWNKPSSALKVTAVPAEYASPVPPYGMSPVFTAGMTSNVCVAAVWTNAQENLIATCAGWKLYDTHGVLKASGADNAFTYEHPDPVEFRNLEWQWTRQYKVSATAAEGGTVSAATTWVQEGDNISLTAIPASGYVFFCWEGDVPADKQLQNPLVMPIADAKTVRATFASTAGGTKTWTGNGDGTSWEDDGNWSPTGVPGAANDVTIAGATVYAANTVLAKSLTIAADGGLYLGSTGSVTAAYAALPDGFLYRKLRFTVTDDVSVAGKFVIGGRYRLDSDVIYTNLTFSIGGDLTLSGSARAAIYAPTTVDNIKKSDSDYWDHLFALAPAVAIGGDFKILDSAIYYPSPDRLVGVTLVHFCDDFTLDTSASVNSQNRGWGYYNPATATYDSRATLTGSYSSKYWFTLAYNPANLGAWGDGTAYASPRTYAPYGVGSPANVYNTPSDGGGNFTLRASGTATINGTIQADGSHNAYSGNSGGGIWLSVKKIVAGANAQLNAIGGHNTHGSGTAGKGGAISLCLGLTDAEWSALAAGTTPSELGLNYIDEINDIPATARGGENGYKDSNGLKTYAASGKLWTIYGSMADTAVTIRSATDAMGAPSPAYGATSYPKDTEVTFTCPGYGYDPSSTSIRYSCVGYVVSNLTAEVTHGDTASFNLTIGTDPLFIYWIWGNRETASFIAVPENCSVVANGSVNLPVGSTAVWSSETAFNSLAVQPSEGYEFLCWEGEVEYGKATDNPYVFSAAVNRNLKPVIRAVEAATTRTFSVNNAKTVKVWTDPTVWSPAGIPGTNDNIVIAGKGTMLVSNYLACASLTVKESAVLNIANTAFEKLEEARLVVAGDLLITNTAALTVAPKNKTRRGVLLVGGDLLHLGTGALTVSAGPTNHVDFTYVNGAGFVTVGGDFILGQGANVIPNSEPWTGGSVRFDIAGSFIAATNSIIKANDNGFQRVAGRVPVTYAPGWGESYTKGGGYGGFGGGYNATYGRTYGFEYAPVYPGSCAGSYGDHPGGGLIRIHAAANAILGGILDANARASTNDASSASGGGIWVTAGRHLRVLPGAALKARGGKRCTGAGTFGGGGRIALVQKVNPEQVDELAVIGEIATWKMPKRDQTAKFNELYPGVFVDVRAGEDNTGVYQGTFRFLNGQGRNTVLILK